MVKTMHISFLGHRFSKYDIPWKSSTQTALYQYENTVSQKDFGINGLTSRQLVFGELFILLTCLWSIWTVENMAWDCNASTTLIHRYQPNILQFNVLGVLLICGQLGPEKCHLKQIPFNPYWSSVIELNWTAPSVPGPMSSSNWQVIL